MKRISIYLAASVLSVALAGGAMALPGAKQLSPDSGVTTEQVKGGHGHGGRGHGWGRGGRGKHMGWHRGRGHHYGWYRGRGNPHRY